MAKSFSDLETIFRQAVGGLSSQDLPSSLVYSYLLDFDTIDSSLDVKLFEQKSYYEFSLPAGDGEYALDLEAQGYSALRTAAWINGYGLWIETEPAAFFNRWPETTTYEATRPSQVLWYDNKLVFRSPPDVAYSVKIQAYKMNSGTASGSQTIRDNKLYRYITYGAAMNFLIDNGDDTRLEVVSKGFELYRNLVLADGVDQYLGVRGIPSF